MCEDKVSSRMLPCLFFCVMLHLHLAAQLSLATVTYQHHNRKGFLLICAMLHIDVAADCCLIFPLFTILRKWSYSFWSWKATQLLLGLRVFRDEGVLTSPMWLTTITFKLFSHQKPQIHQDKSLTLAPASQKLWKTRAPGGMHKLGLTYGTFFNSFQSFH